MYSTCLFCNHDLGANQVIEPFPVGRRLAYDAARGRLWVVCRHCERWNLTPLEERWEAIEECERQYAGTRQRVSTENVGLARLREGLELVRIGTPLLPEMAAWRYGDQFGRRMRRHALITGGTVLAVAGFAIGGPMVGLIGAGSISLINIPAQLAMVYRARRVRAVVDIPGDAAPLMIRGAHLDGALLLTDGERWRLRIQHDPAGTPRQRRRHEYLTLGLLGYGNMPSPVTRDLDGDDALRVAGRLLPAINASGAGRRVVGDAVTLLEDSPGPDGIFAGAHAHFRTHGVSSKWIWGKIPGLLPGEKPFPVHRIPAPIRLAMEMAANDEHERRAMEGELALLEDEWRLAEEIAAIADQLLVPPDVERRLAGMLARKQNG
jgi:hypothetical protein